MKDDKELMEATNRVRELVAEMRASKWDIGRALARVHQVVVARGAAVEGGFDRYCRRALGMHATTAAELERVSLWFTRDEVAKHGWKKLALVMQAPMLDRAVILQAVREGASKRDVEARVREANKRVRAQLRGSSPNRLASS